MSPDPKAGGPPAERDPVSTSQMVNAEATAVAGYRQEAFSSESSESPFPLPDLIARYKEVMPGLEERLITLIESQHKHRISMEKKEQDAEIKDGEEFRAAAIADLKADRLERYRGQWFGFTLGSIAILGAVVTAAFDKPAISALIGGGGIATLATAFIYSRHQKAKIAAQSKDAEDK